MKGRVSGGLVTEFLEKVSGVVLDDPQYRHVISGLIKGHAGIYALYKGDALYYVGLASNLMPRVKHHLKDRHARKWDAFSVYLTREDEHIKPLESLLLRIVEPKGNRVNGRLPGAKDQKRLLAKQMNEADSNRRASLLGGHFIRNRLRKKTAQASGTVGLAGLVSKRVALKAELKGTRYSATLRKDGYISYKGELYRSPTMAGKAAIGRNVNGWTFWTYRSGRAGWVPLTNLRK